MTTVITGGCACGAVRYTCSEGPQAQLLCHCRDCQRASGSAFAACLALPADHFQITGTLQAYTLLSQRGHTMQRLFCPACGAPVAIARLETPQLRFVHAASLDDPAIFSPTCEVWVSRAQAWHPHLAHTLKLAEGLTSAKEDTHASDH